MQVAILSINIRRYRIIFYSIRLATQPDLTRYGVEMVLLRMLFFSPKG